MATRTKPKRRRMGRPAGSPPNRAAIVAAARKEFSRLGYDRATIRGIAAEAGVDPALVHHYFGTKERLLVAALSLPINPAEMIPAMVRGGVDGLGERIVRRFLQVWESEVGARGAFVGLLRTAASHEEAARMIRQFFQREVLGRIAETLQVSQPRLRTGLVASQLMGLAMARFVIRLEPIARADPETLIACYAPTIQSYLTGTLPGAEARSPTLPSKGEGKGEGVLGVVLRRHQERRWRPPPVPNDER